MLNHLGRFAVDLALFGHHGCRGHQGSAMFLVYTRQTDPTCIGTTAELSQFPPNKTETASPHSSRVQRLEQMQKAREWDGADDVLKRLEEAERLSDDTLFPGMKFVGIARPLTNSKKCQECREEAEKTEAIASLVQEEADEPGPKFYTDPICNYGSM